MTLLLDTHAFLWFCQDDPLLSTTAKALIEDASNRKLLSVASCWEIAIKAGLRKLRLGEPSAAYYPGNQDPHKSLQPIRSSSSRSRLPRDQRSPRNPPKYTEKRIRINFPFPFPCPSRGQLPPVGWGRSVVTRL